jgi:lipopolysaccharide/colanic/teichoic acid biosynthesis glycosyltransferase
MTATCSPAVHNFIFYLVQAATIPHKPPLSLRFSQRRPGFDTADSLQLKFRAMFIKPRKILNLNPKFNSEALKAVLLRVTETYVVSFPFV